MLKRKNLRQSTTLAFFILAALLLTQSLWGDIENNLRRSGTIAGQVVKAATGEPLPLVEIEIWNESGDYRGTALTDMRGRYSIDGLVAGRYFAATLDSGFADVLYGGAPCPFDECEPTTGSPIEVRGGAVTAGIDFALSR